MLNHRLSRIFICSFAVSIATCAFGQSTFRVFYLGGQSNMEGFGYNKDLPAELARPMKNVYIFDGNRGGDGEPGLGVGKWEQLRPGHGTGFASDGKENKASDRFGIELAFARRMQELYPNDKIAIIKYARNGSSIDSLAAGPFGCWDPDYNGKPNQYDFFLNTVNGAYASSDVNGDGKPDTLAASGILWMQGEGDGSFTEEIAGAYHANLKKLVDAFRAVFRTDDLPVVIGKISDSGNDKSGIVFKHGDLVQYAQEKFCRTDAHAAIVRSTSKYAYSDPWHYDSAGYLDLGKNFAEAMSRLMKPRN